MSLTTLPRAAAYYASMLLFGVAALALNLVGFACAWLKPSQRTETFFQGLIHAQVKLYFRWVAWVGVVRVEYRNWQDGRGRGCVLVANHPGMLDAFYLLAREPRGFCVFKTAIRRNPLFGAIAQRAGYLSNDRGVELVRRATEKIGAGATLIIFPEGTRTVAGAELARLRPGFALIARRARVAVQLVRISVDGALLAKHRAWWLLPPTPVRVVVEAGPRLEAETYATTEALVAAVEAWFRAVAEPRGQLTPPLGARLTVA